MDWSQGAGMVTAKRSIGLPQRDFLKPRKRLANSGKKSPAHKHKHECGHGAHIRPPKVARLAQAHFKRTS
ncbi:jg7479 [Pararge aegeria aegeria]|uniref:Jg7479 protein n=1 Tax=Pararge aegeria aegeria TaxID=348720 RepID=A0A8S4R5G9_9NEOP|nr:jg7479 [Pararge aegeria aegeria]